MRMRGHANDHAHLQIGEVRREAILVVQVACITIEPAESSIGIHVLNPLCTIPRRCRRRGVRRLHETLLSRIGIGKRLSLRYHGFIGLVYKAAVLGGSHAFGLHPLGKHLGFDAFASQRIPSRTGLLAVLRPVEPPETLYMHPVPHVVVIGRFTGETHRHRLNALGLPTCASQATVRSLVLPAYALHVSTIAHIPRMVASS